MKRHVMHLHIQLLRYEMTGEKQLCMHLKTNIFNIVCKNNQNNDRGLTCAFAEKKSFCDAKMTVDGALNCCESTGMRVEGGAEHHNKQRFSF